jgi:hypothetical protein
VPPPSADGVRCTNRIERLLTLDGQKVLLAVKNMGGESEAAPPMSSDIGPFGDGSLRCCARWRALLDDLVARGLRIPTMSAGRSDLMSATCSD